MKNKKLLLIELFLSLFISANQSGLAEEPQPNTLQITTPTDDVAVFSERVHSPSLYAIKKETPQESIPMMENIAEKKIKQSVTMELQTQVEKSDKIKSKKAKQHKKQTKNKKVANDPKKAVKQDKIIEKNEIVPHQSTNTQMRLPLKVENVTGKTIYVCCFSYVKKRAIGKWRWDKSTIYELQDNQKTTIYTDEIEDNEDRSNTFGYLGVFENKEEAEESILELLSDKKKIDLDLIMQLRDKTVKIEIEKYGIHGEFYDYDFVKETDKKNLETPRLDFSVENKTGKPILATCFVYEKKAKGSWLAKKTTESWRNTIESRDDMSIWRFDKTSIIKINPNETGTISVDTIIEPRDREYVRGYLILFDEDEASDAENATYELLPSTTRKIDLGRLINLKNKKISIYTEKYGTSNFIDYTVQSTQKIDVSKITKKY